MMMNFDLAYLIMRYATQAEVAADSKISYAHILSRATYPSIQQDPSSLVRMDSMEKE